MVVALPGGVALAEGVERRARHREASLVGGGARLEDVVAAGRHRRTERHGHRRAGHVPLARRHFLALGLPRVEAVPFGPAHALPLNLSQADVDRHTRNRGAVEADGHELGLDAVLLIVEKAEAAHADIPRRGMHDEAFTVGDVLPRDVFDVPFERVGVRNAGCRLGLECQRQLSVGSQLRVGRPHLGLGRLVAVLPADEGPPLLGKLAGDRVRRAEQRRARQGPVCRPLVHRRTEQVARVDHSLQWIARDRRVPCQRHVDTEIGPAVGGDEERAEHHLLAAAPVVVSLVFVPPRPLLRLLFLEDGAHGIVAERALRRHGERPLGRTPRVDLDDAVVDDLVAGVGDADRDLGPLGQQLDAVGGVATQQRLDVYLLAELVDAAVGEDGSAQQRLCFVEVEFHAVVPRQHAFVPVAADVGDVAVLLGHDDEGEGLPVVRIAQPRLRRDDGTVVASGARPRRTAVGTDDRHLRARNRRGVVEPCHEDECVLRAVLDGDPEIGDLDDGRVCDGISGVIVPGFRVGNGISFLDRGPDDPGAVWREHAGQIEPVRIGLVDRTAEPARERRGVRRVVEAGLQ